MRALVAAHSSHCTICMDDFTLYEQIRCLPCEHLFHSDCIVRWLQLVSLLTLFLIVGYAGTGGSTGWMMSWASTARAWAMCVQPVTTTQPVYLWMQALYCRVQNRMSYFWWKKKNKKRIFVYRQWCPTRGSSASWLLFLRWWRLNPIELAYTKGRFHRPGLTLQLANPRLRDNGGLSPACVPSLSVNLTAHLTCDLTSFR